MDGEVVLGFLIFVAGVLVALYVWEYLKLNLPPAVAITK